MTKKKNNKNSKKNNKSTKKKTSSPSDSQDIDTSFCAKCVDCKDCKDCSCKPCRDVARRRAMDSRLTETFKNMPYKEFTALNQSITQDFVSSISDLFKKNGITTDLPIATLNADITSMMAKVIKETNPAFSAPFRMIDSATNDMFADIARNITKDIVFPRIQLPFDIADIPKVRLPFDISALEVPYESPKIIEYKPVDIAEAIELNVDEQEIANQEEITYQLEWIFVGSIAETLAKVVKSGDMTTDEAEYLVELIRKRMGF